MKICLFGGTFDPPHLGHLLIAQTVCEVENFDKIVFIPALKPPHKNRNKITPVKLRLEMLESAVLDNPRFEISQMEIQRGGTSYSLDTIKQFKINLRHIEIILKKKCLKNLFKRRWTIFFISVS